jgi:hypothetical protein
MALKDLQSNLAYFGKIPKSKLTGRHVQVQPDQESSYGTYAPDVTPIDNTPTPTNPSGRHVNYNVQLSTPLNPFGRHNNTQKDLSAAADPIGRHDNTQKDLSLPGDTIGRHEQSPFEALPSANTDLSATSPELTNGYTPNDSINDTKFSYNDDLTVSTEIKGYGNDGAFSTFRTSISADGFIHNAGDAKRLSQLGGGTTFPIGPEGQVHEFDKVRLGFSPDVKYGDAYGVNSNTPRAGLMKTYLDTSPIDDMYNKLNLRDDSHDPFGYAKPPFILRGIQRKDNSDTQLWGLGDSTAGLISSTLDLPRGGVLTSAERAITDAVRIGKFLIRPNGITFLAKQFGLQLMNPNTEGVSGKANPLGVHKIYDPLSSIANSIGGFLGLRTDRIFPPIVKSPLTTYEEVLKARQVLDKETSSNRLIQLKAELLPGEGDNPKVLFNTSLPSFGGQEISILSGKTGPGSLLGIGTTSITKADIDTSLKGQYGQGSAPAAGRWYSFQDKEARRDTYGSPYLGTIINAIDWKSGDATVEDVIGGDKNESYLMWTNLASLMQDSKSDPPFEIFRVNSRNGQLGYRGGGASQNEGAHKSTWKTNDYDQLEAMALERSDGSILTHDFRTTEGTGNDVTVNEYDRTEANNPLVTKTTENIPNKGHIDVSRHDKAFNAGGINVRSDAEGTEITDQTIQAYKTLAYPDLTKPDGEIRKTFKEDDNYEADNLLLNRASYRDYNPGTRESTGDPIQSFVGSEGPSDLIKFSFQALRTDDQLDSPSGLPIQFRAYINALNDSFAPGWSENNDQGRADAKIMLESWARTISVDFLVPMHSKSDLDGVWTKLDEMAKLTYPVYASSGFAGTYVKVTIGDLYVGVPMYVQDLSYDWDNETPWELEDGKQVPYYTNVNMTFGWIGAQRPSYEGNVFSLNGVT